MGSIARTAIFSAMMVGIGTHAYAAPELLVTGGVLEGARGVSVQGRIYDVAFTGGPCTNVFPDCTDASSFTIRTASHASAAAQALLDQVLVDGTAHGDFYDFRGKVTGCTDPEACGILTPFDRGGVLDRIYAATAAARPTGLDDPTVTREIRQPYEPGNRPPADLSLGGTQTWANWRPNIMSMTLDVVDGVLYGARNVWVNGRLYNVQFEDASCNALFGDCMDNGVFDFHSEADARAATQALFAKVLLDGQPEGDFFDYRGKIKGCESTEACWIFTPFAWGPDPDLDRINVVSADAGPAEDDVRRELTGPGAPGHTPVPDLDLSLIDSRTWARWTAVPEPTSFGLNGIALLATVYVGRLRRKSA